MSDSAEATVIHKGFIDRFTNNSVIVKIVSESACAACHAKGGCTAADMQDKEIEVSGLFGDFKTGESVNLIMERSQGFRALLLGYVYPFIVLFTGLLVASATGLSDLSSGLLALGLLPPYYFVIYLLRKNIRNSFNFSIRKIN